MATIDYKEKYEKAVQAAMLAKQDTESAVTIGILEEIFPELKESEDERIRKELISHFNSYKANCSSGWSLGALLGLMPAGCSLRSRKGFTADKKIYFCTCPFNNDDPINYNSSIEAAYNMVIWLLENNYIKTEKP